MSGFKLLELTIRGTKDFKSLENVIFKFSEEQDRLRDFPFVTLVIGANSTGKSRLLRIVLDIFNDLYNLKTEDKIDFAFKGGYKIIYQSEEDLFEIINGRADLSITKNAKKISIDKLKLPNKLIAVAFSITDRFPYQITTSYNQFRPVNSRYQNPFYEYLGVRTINNMASSSGHITRTLDLLSNATVNRSLNNSLLRVFDFLNLKPWINVEYRIRNYGSILERNKLSATYLKAFIKKLDEKKAGFAYRYFLELLENQDKIKEVVEYINQLKARGGGKNAPLFFTLDFSNLSSLDNFFKEYEMLDLLRKLNFVSYNSITIEKNDGSRFDMNKGSSGEIHLLTSLLSLGCVIDDQSIVLIDEPEISLHPNWQMQYLDLMNSVFHSRFKNCHFIVCTHSHFLVSDLRPESSFIISLKNDLNFNLIAKSIPFSTYGWSAEQILLEVFNAPTTRNYFVADRVGEILDLVSRSRKNVSLIRSKVRELLELNIINLDDSDPLKKVIDKLSNTYGKD